MKGIPVIVRFRIALGLFIIGLVVSGVTAFPLLTEIRILDEWLSPDGGTDGGAMGWIGVIRHGLEDTYGKYPWIAYGTDWLAFGHLMIALFFIGPFLDPRTARGNLLAGMAACVAVIPLALISGPLRGIPVFWRLIDCSFGVLGILPLIYCWRLLPGIEKGENELPAGMRRVEGK